MRTHFMVRPLKETLWDKIVLKNLSENKIGKVCYNRSLILC